MTDNQLRVTWTDYESPTRAVIAAVAETEDRSPSELPPLYQAVTPDALDDLLTHAGEAADADITLSFTYLDYQVTIDGSGTLTLTPASQPAGDDDRPSSPGC